MGRRIVWEAKSPLDGMFAQPEGVDDDGDAA